MSPKSHKTQKAAPAYSGNMQKHLRMARFIAEVRKNKYPNKSSFARLLREKEDSQGEPRGCDPRTIARDIEDLRSMYNAPLEYDHEHNGYYLSDPDWDYTHHPASEDFIDMALLAGALSANILPHNWQNELKRAMTESASHPGGGKFFDFGVLPSLLCFSSIKTKIDPEVFQEAFDAWQCRTVITFTYRKPPDGQLMEYCFEPHILAFANGSWYLKGHLHGKNDAPAGERLRIFALHRITKIRAGTKKFTRDKQLLKATRENGLFDFPLVENVKLRVDTSLGYYLREQQAALRAKISELTEGALLVDIPVAPELEMVHLVLNCAGKISVLAPESLRQAVATAASQALAANQ